MKKMNALLLVVTLTTLLLTGCGSNTKSTTDADASKEAAVTKSAETTPSNDRTKITCLFRGSESGEQYKIFNDLLTKFCDEKGLEPEIELVNSDADYVTKLQLYINSNSLPDIFGCPNGALSAAAKNIDALVNVGEELKKIDRYNGMNKAVVDFLTDADDGQLYLFPQGLYCEYFVYRTDKFKEYGLKVPTTWDEFLNCCSVLKEKGDIPVVVAGTENWCLMRYLSFAPWRVTKDQFIKGYINQTDSFSKNTAAQAGVNLLYTLGQKEYFQPGYLSTDYTAAADLFFGGTGDIMYSNSGQISLASDMYKNGELGFFAVPDVSGQENMSTNIPIHAGFATAFNKQTYDSTMQEFFKYMCDNYTDECYNTAGIFSPFNDDIPEGLDQMYYDLWPLFKNAEQSWVSWDDKLDSATLTNIVDEQQKLVNGSVTPEDFEKVADQFIINNSK